MRYGMQSKGVAEWFAMKAGLVPQPILDVILGPMQGRALMIALRTSTMKSLAERPCAAVRDCKCSEVRRCVRAAAAASVAWYELSEFAGQQVVAEQNGRTIFWSARERAIRWLSRLWHSSLGCD